MVLVKQLVSLKPASKLLSGGPKNLFEGLRVHKYHLFRVYHCFNAITGHSAMSPTTTNQCSDRLDPELMPWSRSEFLGRTLGVFAYGAFHALHMYD